MRITVPEPLAATQVVAGVIRNAGGEILLALRPPHLREGGLWEFPGGKREPGESRSDALARELNEELDIRVRRATPLIRVPHEYSYLDIVLDVWEIDDWQGTPAGREGQQLRWVPPAMLDRYRFPAANRPILTAARLPRLYAITPEPHGDRARFLARLSALLEAGVRLLQLRARTLDDAALRELLARVLPRCEAAGAELLVNCAPALALRGGAHGVHLPAAQLMQLNERPAGPGFRVAASCHNRMQLEHAMRLPVDFVVLGPVHASAEDPRARGMGWHGLKRLLGEARIPVFALGGMQIRDLRMAILGGCQGIAAVHSLWGAEDAAAALRAAATAVRETATQIPQI